MKIEFNLYEIGLLIDGLKRVQTGIYFEKALSVEAKLKLDRRKDTLSRLKTRLEDIEQIECRCNRNGYSSVLRDTASALGVFRRYIDEKMSKWKKSKKSLVNIWGHINRLENDLIYLNNNELVYDKEVADAPVKS